MVTPGIVISAPASGTGKTTVTLGLLAALARGALAVQPFKCGPDYIDPAFHSAAAGRASVNIDSWAMDAGRIARLTTVAADADLVIAEGAMGLFDGVAQPGRSGVGASADIAAMMGWPVVLVLDCGGQAQSAAAVAKGFQTFRDDVTLAGVVLNRVASPRHERLVRDGMDQAGITVFGALPRNTDLALPERHLGLVQAGETADLKARLFALADLAEAHLDLDALVNAAFPTARQAGSASLMPPPGQRIALATDAAFSFTYPHLKSDWRDAGAEILPFSPLADEAPDPSADVAWLPGGYPELHAGRIASAPTFLSGLRAFAETRPVHGECGGYMVLGQSLEDKDGVKHRMAGLLGLETSFAKRRLHLGYRRARLKTAIPGFGAGVTLRGHEFHYARIIEHSDAPLADVTDATGATVEETGSRRGNVTGTFFHMIAEDA